MSYDEDEVLNDSGFNPNSENDDLDDNEPLFDETLDDDETPGFKFDEEEPEGESL